MQKCIDCGDDKSDRYIKGLCRKCYMSQRYHIKTYGSLINKGKHFEEIEERKELHKTGKKNCPKCSEIKDFCEFNKDKHHPLGITTYCKKCLGSSVDSEYNIKRAEREQLKSLGLKRCNKCDEIKELDKFPFRKKGNGGYYSSPCKKCRNKEKHKKEQEKRKEKTRIKREEIESLAQQGLFICKTCGEIKKLTDFPTDKRLTYGIEHTCKLCRTTRQNERRDNPTSRLNNAMSSGINKSLKGNKNSRWRNMVNYSIGDLKFHLSTLWTEGMTWENYGEWHVDHIKPKSSFSIKSQEDEDFKKCWSLGNLQPLWAEDNLRKGSRWCEE